VIWIIGLQTGCIGLGFEVTVILQRIRVLNKLDGSDVDSRDVKSGTGRTVFYDRVDNFDSQTGNVRVQLPSAVLESFISTGVLISP